MTSKSTVGEIAEFADGCANSAIQPDVRDIDPHHPFDSIGCAIGVMGAKVTQDIKAFGRCIWGQSDVHSQACQNRAGEKIREGPTAAWRPPDDHPSLSDLRL
jgi:hypothetical protein